MDYVDSISGTENVEQEKRAEHHRHKHTKALQLSTEYVLVMITLSSACIQSVCVGGCVFPLGPSSLACAAGCKHSVLSTVPCSVC